MEENRAHCLSALCSLATGSDIAQGVERANGYDHETFVVQGVLPQDSDVYGFTNGQITFDRHARLGSQTMARYLVETNDGFASDAVRVVLTE